jgi:NitT/TauT family transport system permease protein
VTMVVDQPSGDSARVLGARAAYWLPAVVVFGLGLVAWEWLLPWLGIERFLLPPFSDVVTAFWDAREQLLEGGWITFKEALAGFALGCSTAFVSALVLARWRLLGSALMPYMIAANAVPIIAFAPITNAWFGLLSPWSKIVIAAVLCFFPVLVNTLRGLTSVRPEALELMRSYAAPQRAVFLRVRIPNSLPFVFTALKVASVLAMIGAVVGDYFGGSIDALGVQILSSVSLSRYETAWAAILLASILGIAFYAAIALVERLALNWHPSTRTAK